MSDAHWALIEPVFTVWRARRTGPGTATRVHDLRGIVNAILYVNRTGIPWEYLPHDFPLYKTVYDYYAKWEADGTNQQIHNLLRDQTRRLHGRRAEPTAAGVDAQSVKTSANVAESSQGIDAGKKIKGRKRHLITDTLGLVLAVLVTAANVHDTTVDAGYDAPRIAHSLGDLPVEILGRLRSDRVMCRPTPPRAYDSRTANRPSTAASSSSVTSPPGVPSRPSRPLTPASTGRRPHRPGTGCTRG